MKTTIFKTAAMAAALAAFALSGCAAQPAAIPNTLNVSTVTSDTITVSSSEKIQIVPDMADIRYAVNTQSLTAEECQKLNNESLQKVIDLLTGMEIPETSIQTSDFNLSPRYDWSNNNQVLIGYEMTTTLTVSDRPLDQVGTILTQSVNAGINSIENVSYKASNYDKSYEDALKKAIESSKVKAGAMAVACGRNLGAVARMEEFAPNQEVRYSANTKQRAAGTMDSAVMEVMPGQIDVEAKISVDYYLQ